MTMREHIHAPAYSHKTGQSPQPLDDHIRQPKWDEPTRRGTGHLKKNQEFKL